MKVTALVLTDYRNYSAASVSFGEGINVLYGDNGAGKTNLLEAVFLFASGKSFRGQKDRELIRFGCEQASVKMTFSGKSGDNTLEAKLYRGKKRVFYKNGMEINRLSEYLGLFRAVVFTPDHLSLVKGAPELRRRFLDLAICQTYPRFVASLNEHNRVLAQKNALLKQMGEQTDDALLAVYNDRLAVSGALVSAGRRRYLARLAQKAAAIHGEMTEGKEKLQFRFLTQAGENDQPKVLEESYRALLEEKKQLEKQRRMPLCGANHDDFGILLNDKNTRSYASQGQQRSTVLALKLAEGQLSAEMTGEEGVYLLDDILSELDEGRKTFILEKLKGKQYLVTGCDEGDFDRSGVRKFRIENGVVYVPPYQ